MNKPSSSLGRGLNSLIPQKGNVSPVVADTYDTSELRHIPVDAIRPNSRQPRTHFDEEALAELAASIKTHGVLQPIVVSESDDGYEIIMGERRWRAALAAGIATVPAVVRAADDQERLELALIENIVREDLNPVELARAYQGYIEEFGLTHEVAAQRLGKSRSVISNTIRLLQLPGEIQDALRDGKLSDAHAKVILGLPTPAQQLACYRQVVDRRLSVARTRVAIEKMGGTKEARVKTDARDEDMEKKLRQHLSTRVSIHRAGYKGRVMIEFFNYDELVDIVQKILNE